MTYPLFQPENLEKTKKTKNTEKTMWVFWLQHLLPISNF